MHPSKATIVMFLRHASEYKVKTKLKKLCLKCSGHHGDIPQLRNKEHGDWPLTFAYATSLMQREGSCPTAWTRTCLCAFVLLCVCRRAHFYRRHLPEKDTLLHHHPSRTKVSSRTLDVSCSEWITNSTRTLHQMEIIKASRVHEEVLLSVKPGKACNEEVEIC